MTDGTQGLTDALGQSVPLSVGLGSIMIIIKKSEFIGRVRAMENPKIIEVQFCHDLLNLCFCIWDSNNVGNKFQTQGVVLTGLEYRTGKLDKYYERERKLKIKVCLWFLEATGHNAELTSPPAGL